MKGWVTTYKETVASASRDVFHAAITLTDR